MIVLPAPGISRRFAVGTVRWRTLRRYSTSTWTMTWYVSSELSSAVRVMRVMPASRPLTRTLRGSPWTGWTTATVSLGLTTVLMILRLDSWRRWLLPMGMVMVWPSWAASRRGGGASSSAARDASAA